MSKVFEAYSNQGLELKILFDIQYDTVEIITLIISYNGIRSSSICRGSRLGTSFYLDNKEFNEYYLNKEYFPESDSVVMVSLRAEDLYNILKCMKKGNHLSMFINETTTNILNFEISWTGGSTTVIKVNIIDIGDNMDSLWDEPQGYSDIPSFIVSSVDFQKAFKQMTEANGDITIKFQEKGISMSAGVEGFLLRNHVLGKYSNKKDDTMNRVYSDKVIGRTIKINSLKNNIKFFYSSNNHLMITSNVGTLGYVRVYMMDSECD